MDEDKNSDRFILSRQNVDLQKQAEDTIQKSENLYRSLFDNMLNGYAYCKMIFENGAPQDFTYIAVNSAFEKLTGLKSVVGKNVSEVIPGIQESNPELFQIYGRVALTGNPESFETYLDSLGLWLSVVAYSPEKEHFVAVFEDVTERKMIDEEKEITIDLFRLLNADNDIHELMKEVTLLLRDWSGCEAVGIRLHDGDDFPYFETRGFPAEFIELENKLCAVDQDGELIRDSNGNPVLECMCGNIICGRVNPELPFFTKGGSFWTNCTTELLATTSEEDRQARTRNRCNSEGYESVALVPLRSVEGCLGLFQFNDKRKGRFTKKKIELFERLASNLAIAISQRKAVRELKHTTQILETIFDSTHLQVAYLDPQFNFIMVNRAYADGAEKEIGFFTGKNNFDLFPDPDTKVEFLRVVETGQPYFAYAIPYEYPDNPERSVTYWDWSLVPIKDNEGVVTSLVFTLENVTERMHMEERLRENQERYRIITDNMRDTVWLMDLNLRTTWISPSVTRTRGFTLEELQEMPIDKQLTPESLNRVMKLYQENMIPDRLLNPEVDVTISEEVEYYLKNGSIRWSNTVITLLRGINGEPTGFLCVGRDITERMASEKMLRDSVSRFKELFDSSMNAIAIYETGDDGENFVFKDLNKVGEQIEKVRREDVIGKSVMEAFPGVKEFGLFDVFQRVWKTGIPEEYPISFYKDNRIAGWRDNYVYKLLSGEIVAIYEDVSERKQAEEKLRENEARYHNVIAQAGGVVYQRDNEQNTYTFIDEGIIDLTGYSANEITSKIFMKIIEEEISRIDQEITYKTNPQSVGDKAFTHRAEYRIRTKDGNTKFVSDSELEVQDINGDVIYRLGMLQDITERKQAEVELLNSRILLQASIESPTGIVIMSIDTNYRYLCFNTTHREAMKFAYNKDVEIGMNVLDCITSDIDRQKAKDNYDRAMAGESHSTIEVYGSDNKSYYESFYNPIFDAQKEIIGITAYAMNITERKQTEQKISDLARFPSENPSPVLRISADGDILYGNTASKLLQDIWNGNYTVSDLPKWKEAFNKALNTGEVDSIEINCPDKVFSLTLAPITEHDYVNVYGLDITERKQAEEALWESEEIFRRFMEYSPVYVFFKDENARGLRMSSNFETMLGKPVAELLGKNMYELFPSELAKSMVADDMRIMKEGKTITIEEELNGRIYTTIKFPIQIEGKPRYLAGYSIDITERKQAENLLRENEEKYRALVDGLPDVIMRFDQNARHIYVSDSVTKDTGVLPGEFIGKTHKELGFPEEQSEYWEQAIFRVFDTGKIVEDEFEFDGINGHIIYNWRLVPEINESGDVKTVLSIARDVTEHRKSEKSYQDMFNSMINGFALHEIICDESGPINYRFIDVNPAFEKLTGLNRDLVVGNTVLDVMPETEPYWIDIYGKVALTGEPIRFENCSNELGKHFEIIAYSPQKGQFAAIFSDITDRKQAEALQERLQQTTKLESIGRLAGGVAHDFNNMLTVIQGSTSLAMMGLNHSDPLFNRLKMIEDASDRATGLTRQLLAFSRKQIIEPKIINLNDIITNLQKMLGRLIGEDIELQTFLDENPANINADPGQIEQIIINLAVNSRDAMPDGGKLTIETSNVFLDESYCRMHPNTLVGNYVQMTISDSGYGMSEDTKEHIFEPFFTTKKLGEGTGLGLATVYGIVKQHNGSIECYSELDHGTIFKIYLPEDVEGKVSELEGSEKIDIVVGSETVLLVEDDNFVREVTTDFLKHLGYNVLVAENGGMAFIIAEQYNQTIHLLLTDIVMPGINGRQLAERLLEIHPEMNVLYTSGYTQNVIAHHGVLEEGLNFIGKPFRLKDLAEKIREVLSQKH